MLAPGCKKSPPPGDASATGAGAPAARPRPPSQRPALRPYRSLLAEAARAELDAGGLFIDMGTADQHKYTRGGWGTGWGAPASEGTTTYAPVEAANTALDVHLQGAAEELVLRVHATVPDQKVTLYFDGAAIRTADVPAEWTELRLPVGKAPATPGRHAVRLVWKNGPAGGGARARVDWLWLARQAGASAPLPVPRTMPVRMGGAAKRALVAPGPRTYAFYLEPPEGARLVFDHGAQVAGVTFTVTATDDSGATTELYQAAAESDWQEGIADLSAFAGKAVRVELATSGPEGAAGWGEPEIRLQSAPASRVLDGARPKNLIFILIDTQRADAFAAFNPATQVKTPAYDALAAGSLVFTAAYNNENWTKPSVATTLTGVYPSTHNAKTDSAALSDAVVLASEHFKTSGYQTAGLVANGYVSEKFGFQQGWDSFRNYIREGKKTEAEYVYRDALEWVGKRAPDKPFFLYIQTIDPHVPYRVDAEYARAYHALDYKGVLGPSIEAEEQIKLGKEPDKFSDADRAWLKALYFGEVSYHDAYLGKFLESLESTGVLADTILVITNDHGEELGEHGRWGHGHSLYEELLRAPLLLHYPPMFPPGRVDEVVEHVDLMPTLLDVLGLPPLPDADGTSALPMLAGRAEELQRPPTALAEFGEGRRAIRVGRWKFQRSTGTLRMLFDVLDDPGETQDRVETHLIALRLCELHLGEALASPQKTRRGEAGEGGRRRFEAQQADIDPEMRRQLKALGYFGD